MIPSTTPAPWILIASKNSKQGRTREKDEEEETMRMSLSKTVLAAAAIAASGAVQAGETYPTPEIARIEALDIPNSVAWAMRAELGISGFYVGLAFVCATEGPRKLEATAFFSGFPADRRPVQLAVRTADGSVHRFGPVVRGGPEAGFHSPQLTDLEDAARFARVALLPGSLVSNGFRSFWNRASQASNRAVREAFLACLERHT